MQKTLTHFIWAAFLTCWSIQCNASLIESLYGDRDGFGVAEPIIDGSNYTGGFGDNRGVNDRADAPITDVFGQGFASTSWSHTYLLDGSILSATLEFYAAGLADIGIVTLVAEGLELLELDFGPQNLTTHLLQINLPLSIIDGSTSFTLQGPSTDGWIFDYALLRVETETAGIPTPAAIFLMPLALLVQFFRRRPTLHPRYRHEVLTKCLPMTRTTRSLEPQT